MVDLTDAELATAAQACRAMASQEGTRAKTMEGTCMQEIIENAAKGYAATALKLEAARKERHEYSELRARSTIAQTARL